MSFSGHKRVEEKREEQEQLNMQKGLNDGIYINGEVEGLRITFTADTGAARSVLSTRLYQRLGMEKKPELRKSCNLRGANGMPIREMGKGKFHVVLGSYALVHEFVVADIEDDALLGFDVLMGSEKGPADILLSKGLIVLDGVQIPCFQVGKQSRSRRVTVADDVSIPGQAEAIIDVYIEREDTDDICKQSEYLVEPTQHFKDKYNLVMATTLVDINKSPTCKVRVLNPLPVETTLRQNAYIGDAEQIERIVSVLTEKENKGEDQSHIWVRRVETASRAVTSNNIQDFRIGQGPDKFGAPEHLWALLDKSTKGKTEAEKRVIAALLSRYSDTFSKNEWDIGLTDLTEHAIDTGDAAPIKQRPRRVPLAFAAEEKAAIDDLLKKGVIQKSTSPWASPIVFVRKKSGAVRPCVDYRKVNALVKPDGFPLPRIQDCLDAVGGMSLFSSFDLTSGYFQIPLKKDDVPKSAFTCKYGLFEMTRMPFGLNNSCGTFQRTMELVLQGLQWQTCLVYIDDIIVFGATFEEHIQRVDEVLDRIKKSGLKLKPDKCHLLQTEVVFLGHIVSKDGVRPDPNNIAKVANWPRPENPRQVKQFVATGSYYRRFIKDFAKIAQPLTQLTRKDVKFNWSDDCEKAFVRLKEALTGTEIMGYPLNEGDTFYLDVDASGAGIGGVLSQSQTGRERVLAYASRSLNKAERNYCVTERELLAVVYFVQYFRQYLLGRKFIVRSDHQALVWLFSLKEPNGKIARWIEILAAFDFCIEYRPGKQQPHCDALSRCDNPRDCECSDIDMTEPLKCGPCHKCRRRAEIMSLQRWEKVKSQNVGCSGERFDRTDESTGAIQDVDDKGLTNIVREVATASTNVDYINWSIVGLSTVAEDMRKSQLEDEDIKLVLEAKEANNKPKREEISMSSPACRHYLLLWDHIRVVNGVLIKEFVKRDGSGTVGQIVIPKDLKREVLQTMHGGLMSGHMGTKKTKAKIIQRFYWFNMKEDIRVFIRQCDTCACDKKPPKTMRAPMGSIRTGAPWDVLATDFLGPFPVTAHGNRYILVLTDHFSKYVEVIPVPDLTAETCANKIVNEFISRWGCPVSILSDQGRTYESKLFKELCRMLQVKKLRTSVRNPRCNGQAERFNQTLLKMMRAYLKGEQDNWDLNLGCLAGAYRATPNEATKLSPNLMTLGREVRLPAELVFGCATDKARQNVTNYGDYVDGIREKLNLAHSIARKHLKSSCKRSKAIYDTKMLFNNYNIGDVVWCLAETRKVGESPKLQPAYEGPCLIIQKYSPINFVVKTNNGLTERVVHHNKLKPYEGISIPNWIKKLKKVSN